MSNTGNKKFSTLVEIYTDTALPTGNTKSNDPTDADYIPPILDLINCPIDEPNEQAVNVLKISFVNASNQSILLQNLNLHPSNMSTDAYLLKASLGILPNKDYVVTANQVADFINVQFKLLNSSNQSRLKCTLSYQNQGSFDFIVKRQFNIVAPEQVDQYLVNIPKIGTGNNLNTLKIEFTDNPTSETYPPIVNVGDDKKIFLSDLLQLTGSVSSDQSIVSVSWGQLSGPNTATLSSTNTLISNVSGMIVGTYVFKLTVVDNVGLIGSDTISIEVIPDLNPNGELNVWVDPDMPTTATNISEVRLIPIDGSADIVYGSVVNKTSGTIHHTPKKGTYRLSITINGTISNDRSLVVVWEGELRNITLPESNTYVFDNVIIDEGDKLLLIQLLSFVNPDPTSEIVFAHLTLDTLILSTSTFLPNGLVKQYIGDVKIDFTDQRIAGTAAQFTGEINYNKLLTNNLTSITTTSKQTRSVSNDNNIIIDTVQSSKTYDFTQVASLIEDNSFDWLITNGEGYLIIV